MWLGALAKARQHGANRHLGSDRHDDLGNDAFVEDLDLDGALLGLDNGDDVALLDPLPGLDQPFDDGAGLHVGAERRHPEISHAGRTRLRAAAAIVAGWGNAASSRCPA